MRDERHRQSHHNVHTKHQRSSPLILGSHTIKLLQTWSVHRLCFTKHEGFKTDQHDMTSTVRNAVLRSVISPMWKLLKA